MASVVLETVPKFTAEALKSAAKQSERCHIVPLRLRRAIKKYLREQEEPHMKRKVLRLSESFSQIKEVNLILPTSISKELVEDPLKSVECSQRWKIKSAYGDIVLKYREDETVAYVASRMPAVYSALYRVLSEVRRRFPGFSPAKVLDFGAGTGSAFCCSIVWLCTALRKVWPRSLNRINLVEPSQSMQRAGQSLIKGTFLVFRELLGIWKSLTLLVLVEPGTPQGYNIISQMRSHILWTEKRRSRKLEDASGKECKALMTLKNGAYIVAPCPHDGHCPLDNTGKYCHFVQRLQRTTSQSAER
ncbi:uncharacterized protein [Nicotiana sylvestris]|uniref:uncharacterized protein n=1 Tax=Nicotiana sylvestris TaxID=4096 RepID=UPI00388C79AB